jgi:hypothetical protein
MWSDSKYGFATRRTVEIVAKLRQDKEASESATSANNPAGEK